MEKGWFGAGSKRYTEVIARKYPEQVVIAIAKDQQGKYNPITLGWTMITSHEPPMMAIAVGHKRYSREAIEGAGGICHRISV